MSEVPSRRVERKARQHAANRAAILGAARRVTARDGTHKLSLRAVAGEAGYAPASVYEYFRNRAELVLALGAEDLSQLTRSLRDHPKKSAGIAAAAGVALGILQESIALAAAVAALETGKVPPETERLFNGKLIAALTALADAGGRSRTTRDEQADVVLAAAVIAGLALLGRTGRLEALGFAEQELLNRFEVRFSGSLP